MGNNWEVDNTGKLVKGKIKEGALEYDVTIGHDHNASNSLQVDHNNLLNKGTNSHATIDTKLHDRSHAITSPSDHTSSATTGKILKADANGLPVDAANTDAQVSSAVTNSHARSHTYDSASDHTGTLSPTKIAPSGTNGDVVTTSGGAVVWQAPPALSVHDNTMHTDRQRRMTFDIVSGFTSGSVDAQTTFGNFICIQHTKASVNIGVRGATETVPTDFVIGGSNYLQFSYMGSGAASGYCVIKGSITYGTEGANPPTSVLFEVQCWCYGDTRFATGGGLVLSVPANTTWIQVRCRRDPSNTSDSYTGTVYLVGALILYTADM